MLIIASESLHFFNEQQRRSYLFKMEQMLNHSGMLLVIDRYPTYYYSWRIGELSKQSPVPLLPQSLHDDLMVRREYWNRLETLECGSHWMALYSRNNKQETKA